MNYQDIAEQIIALKNADLELREKLIQNRQLGEGYHKEMEQLHGKNADRLNTIIDTIGYPTPDKVGLEASEAAWLVVQHSIGHPDFMKKCRKLLEEAVHENKANPLHLAYLSDRIAAFEGKPQLYGTQFDWDEQGQLSPKTYDDLAKVNQRRAAIGLNNLEEQTEIMRKQVDAEHQTPPEDYASRIEEMNQWRKKVGWI
jgi:hypothetical protein